MSRHLLLGISAVMVWMTGAQHSEKKAAKSTIMATMPALMLGPGLWTVPNPPMVIMVLKTCAGTTCANPWRVPHPDGEGQSLADSLDVGFDAFYDDQPKVAFSECALGYFPELEGPQEVLSFSESVAGDDGGRVAGGGGQQAPLFFKDWSITT